VINKVIDKNKEIFKNAKTPAQYKLLLQMGSGDDLSDDVIETYTNAIFNKSPEDLAFEKEQIDNKLRTGAIVAKDKSYREQWANIDALGISRPAKLDKIKAHLLTQGITDPTDLSNNNQTTNMITVTIPPGKYIISYSISLAPGSSSTVTFTSISVFSSSSGIKKRDIHSQTSTFGHIATYRDIQGSITYNNSGSVDVTDMLQIAALYTVGGTSQLPLVASSYSAYRIA
jgi:hypothetical protein